MNCFSCNEKNPFVISILSEEDLTIGKEHLKSWVVVDHLCECTVCRSFLQKLAEDRKMIHENIRKSLEC